MPALVYAKVNKETLRFIRDKKQVSFDYIERIAKFPEAKITLWEDETSDKLPTIRQAKELAKCYRVPFAGFYMNSADINVKHLPRLINKRTMIGAVTDDSAVNLSLLDLINERDFYVETKETLGESIPVFDLRISDDLPATEWTRIINIIGTDNVITAAVEAGVQRVVFLSTDKAAYPINTMGMTKAVGEKVVQARAQKAFERGGTVLACTRYGNVMCSRGSVIPLFIDQIKRKAPITITDPNMTRFLMNLDEAVDLVAFAFEHAEPGDLFVQKADASTIGDLADGVMKVFGETEKKIIGSRHGEKLYETLVTREEMLRSVDMGHYYRIAPDARGLNYDKFYVQGTVHTEGDEAYTSHNTNRLDVDGVVKKIMGTDYVKEELEGRPHAVEA